MTLTVQTFTWIVQLVFLDIPLEHEHCVCVPWDRQAGGYSYGTHWVHSDLCSIALCVAALAS